jgi:hypothetical protein
MPLESNHQLVRTTPQSTINNQQSTINNQQSTINNQQSAISNQQSKSTIYNRQSAINNRYSALDNPIGNPQSNRKSQSPIDNLNLRSPLTKSEVNTLQSAI